MLPWPRSVLLRGPRTRPWRFDEVAPLARVQVHGAESAARGAMRQRVLTTGPSHSHSHPHKPQQRPGIASRTPLTHLPPSRSLGLVGPQHEGEHDGFDYAAGVVLPTPVPAPHAPLSVLPLKSVLRSLLISTVSASRPLLSPSLFALSVLASSQNALLNPDRNPLLRALVKQVFYAQFCAGETRAEVDSTINGLKDIGFSGVILCYAKEAVPEESHIKELEAHDGPIAEGIEEITPWAQGTMETITMAQPGDFVALKFTGAGRQALYSLGERAPPAPALASAIDSLCSLAAARGVRLLFDAEQAALQPGIDDWTLTYMRKYNRGRVCVYGTYQAYLKSCAATLSEHLRIAKDEGFSLGVKLVRGAYINSDPRHLIHDTKADTDAMYDGITQAVATRTWGAPLEGSGEWPETSLVVASHNAESVRLAREIVERGEARSEVDFAQLMGMADEVSCTLLPGGAGDASPGVKAYKYLAWGSTGDCMKYLLRRAYENRDAVGRTKEGRDAMGRELVRRVKGMFRLQ